MKLFTLRKLIVIVATITSLFILYRLLEITLCPGFQLCTNYYSGLRERSDGNGISSVQKSDSSKSFVGEKYVDIWSKAAIGSYFWEHIFESSLQSQTESWSYGEESFKNINFRFYTGPGIAPESVPSDVRNIVLIANGREPSKIVSACKWLDYIVEHRSQLINVAVVLLGNERCNNTWITKYMISDGGPVKAVFVVYDSPTIDEEIFYQWPLGVATYRSFPTVEVSEFDLMEQRKYRCNFIGTIYPNSSRETLLRVLRQINNLEAGTCHVKTRNKWMPLETKESMSEYFDVLHNSDLTLNPVGLNTECYRIYEAMAVGSVPVIEDRAVSASCGTPESEHLPGIHRTVLRLLKQYHAPVIYVSDWSELSSVLENERTLSPDHIVARRRHLVDWYRKFRRRMRDVFVDVIDEKFF